MSALRTIVFALLALSGLRAMAQVPEMNQRIVTYLDEVMGTKVGRGECWDLAHDALELVGANWNHQYIFGEEKNPKTDSIYPGDIIQFEKVTLKYEKDNSIYTETYPHHTAVVYSVTAPGEYRIAHQNTGFGGRKVGVSTLRLTDVKSGKMRFYRPVK